MKNKGITLIALVITIIVLLILSSVGIAMLMGDNGILNKSKLAKEKSDASSIEESNRLGSYNQSIENYATTSRSNMQTENFVSDGSEITLNKTYNGKQVYATTITGTTSSSNSTFKDLTTYNIDQVINIYGRALVDSNTNWMDINTYFNTSAFLNFWYNISSKKLGCSCGTQYNGATAYVTVEYTKAS